MTTAILPPALTDTEHASQIEHNQANKEDCKAPVNQNGHFTAFEQFLLAHRNTTSLDQQLIDDIKRLIDALDKRDRYPGRSKARVTCPKCDQHYWYPINIR